MKGKIFVLSIALIMLFTLFVSAQSVEYNITVPDDFTVIHKGDDVESVAKQLKINQAELTDHFTQNGTVYLAISNDSKTQIRLSCFNDNFSSEVGDISRIDSNGLTEFISAIGGENIATTTDCCGRKFVVIKNTYKDSGGIYTATQYVTIANNKTYYLSCYNQGEDTAKQVDDIFKTFSIVDKSIDAPDYTTYLILIWIGIIIFSLVAIIMVISIAKSYIKNKKVDSR